MALVLKDRVKETTSTSGTGTLTLLGAVQGYQAFSSIGNGNTTYYCIQATSDWEVGIGTVGSGTLSRDTVLASSGGGVLVNFGSGLKDVFCTYPAAKSISTDTLFVTIADNTASPNDVINVSSLTANSGSTNADLACVPKGNGALLANIPNGITSGGNKRGSYAVDWQRVRNTSTLVASGNYSVIGGGESNRASASHSVVSGGAINTSSGSWATVGGGTSNQSTANYSTISGGGGNTASAIYTTIGGGNTNTVSQSYGTIAGGDANTTSATYATVNGGSRNEASGSYSIVSGGRQNTAIRSYTTVGGGLLNSATGLSSDSYATVAGGYANIANGPSTTIGGGQSNTATGSSSIVAGGAQNESSGAYSNVSGGIANIASGSRSAVLSGDTNLANGKYAVFISGAYGTARQMIGYTAQSAADPFSGTTPGTAQTGSMLLWMITTNNSSKTMSSDGLSAGFSRNVPTLQDNSAVFFKGSVIANITGAGDTKSWTFQGQIKRGSGAATTTLTGSTVTVAYEDAGASGWTISLSAGTSDGSIRVAGVGATSSTVRWVCKIETVEVGF